MFQINLPPFDTNIAIHNGKEQIFDVLRKRFVALTPEEWVRQHFVHYLIGYKGYPASRLANEITLSLNGMSRRCDSVLFRQDMTPQMIIEYKAPTVPISQKTFAQINAYNQVLHVRYVIASNGLTHYCCMLDEEQNCYTFLKEIPDFSALD